MKGKGLRQADFYFSCILVTFALLLIVESLRMPRMGPSYVAPGLFPAVIGVILLVLSMLILLGSRSTLRMPCTRQGNSIRRWFEVPANKRLVLAGLMLIAYASILLRFLPYHVATFIFLLLMMTVFKAGPIWKTTLVSIAASLAIAYVFGSIFLIPLP